MLYIGIDPGASGGIAVISETGFAQTFKMPETEADVLALLRSYAIGDEVIRATIERVHTAPQMGVVSAFKFGRGVGVLHMALIAAGIPFDEVTPQAWQKMMGCIAPKRVEFGQKDKNITKRRAQALFPNLTITHAVADALLIAEFNRRTSRGVALPARPAQKGLFDGKSEGTEEDRRNQERADEESEEHRRAEEEGERAEAAPTEGAPRHGGSRHRGDRKSRTRLRRRA